eukprot:2845736-Prymnesium_polylepis.1
MPPRRSIAAPALAATAVQHRPSTVPPSEPEDAPLVAAAPKKPVRALCRPTPCARARPATLRL